MAFAAINGGDYIICHDGPSLRRVGDDVTLFFWFYRFGAMGFGGGSGRVFDTTPGDFGIAPIESSGFVRFFAHRWSGGSGGWESPHVPAVGKWSCLGISYSATAGTGAVPLFYAGGVDAGAASTTDTPGGGYLASQQTANDAVYYGDRSTADRIINGAMAHFAIYNRVLSPTEHRMIAQRGPLSVSQGLVSYRPFDAAQRNGGLVAQLAPGAQANGAYQVGFTSLFADPYHGEYVGSPTYRRYWGRRAVGASVSAPVTTNFRAQAAQRFLFANRIQRP